MPSWLIRAALLAYPRAFRRHFGDELRDGLQAAWSAPQDRSPVRHRAALLTRTVTHGLAERGAAIVAADRLAQPSAASLRARRETRRAVGRASLHDLRAAVRSLAAARGFTALAVFALALGIGANGAIFSVVHGVLLKPLPYRDADRLVMLWSANPQAGGAAAPLSPADFDDLRAMSRSFAGMDYALSFIVRTALVGHGEDRAAARVARRRRPARRAGRAGRSSAAASATASATSPC